VFCLGNCALGPAVEVGGKLHGRVTATRLDALLGEAR
jgi:formate dehydrogenase subunit gamma